jgi:hypothetical protein
VPDAGHVEERRLRDDGARRTVLRQAGLDADVYRINTVLRVRASRRDGGHTSGDPYLLIAGINKSWRGDGPLTADHLCGSSRLQFDVDTILMVEPDLAADPAAPSVPVTLRVVKACDGGTWAAIPLEFEHALHVFREAKPGRINKAPIRPPGPATGVLTCSRS